MYADYIARVLTPISTPNSVGYRLLPGTLDGYLETPGDAAEPAAGLRGGQTAAMATDGSIAAGPPDSSA